MPVVVVIRLRAGADGVVTNARELLSTLHARPGFLGGTLAQSVEDDGGVVVIARFADLGSWRRALGAPEVKLVATPLLGAAGDPTSPAATYEVLEEVGPGPEPVRLRR